MYAKHAMLKRNSSQYYSGTLAGKTGYTMTAGNTLVTAARRNGMTLVTCVLNAHANHYNDTRRLMDFGFDNFTSLKVIDYDDTNSAIASDFRISGINMVDSKTLGIDPDTRITIPKGGNYIEVRKSLEVSEDTDGNSTASLIYSYGDRTVGAAKLKLINIGDGSELYEEAKTDPLLANALGIKTDAELEAESESERAAEESSVNEAESSEGSEADGNEASVNGDGDKIQQDSETASIADEAAETAKENTDNAKMKNMGSDGKDTEGVPGDRIDKGELLKKLGFGAVAVIVVLFLLIICNTFRDRRQAERRARRRAARMKRTKDMTGTQQIHMDLELQRRSRKKDKKRRKK